MATKTQSLFSSDVYAAYGKNIALMRKLRYIPFKWDHASQELVAPTNWKQRLEMKIQKFLLLLIVVANIMLPTIGHDTLNT